MFLEADKDRSNTLTFEEFASLRCNLGVSTPALQAIFDKLDLDQDGSLTRLEFARYPPRIR
jgi:Ca2+-binding EF-hand superfamily protein